MELTREFARTRFAERSDKINMMTEISDQS